MRCLGKDRQECLSNETSAPMVHSIGASFFAVLCWLLMPPHSSSIRAVLFDWDGTLLNSFESDAAAYEAMFAQIGIRWGREELKLHYSPNWHRVYVAAGIPEARWPEADRLWRAAYARLRPQLMAHARVILDGLATRYALGIVSSLVSPTLGGFILGSLLLGFPFTAITYFAMQEIRRLCPTHPAGYMGLATALWSLGQIAGPPLAAALLARSRTPAEGFATSLEIAASLLCTGALLYGLMVRLYPVKT